MTLSFTQPFDPRQVVDQLAREKIAQHERQTAHANCGRLLEASGDGERLVEAYDRHLARAVFIGHRNSTSYMLADNLVTLEVLSNRWEDNVCPLEAVDNAVKYEFPDGCKIERFRGWGQEMVAIDLADPRRKLKLEWRGGVNAWFVVSSPGWKQPGAARIHGNSQRFIPGHR